MSKVSMEKAEKVAQMEANKKFDKQISEAELSFKKLITDKVIKKYPVPAIVMKVIGSDDGHGWIRYSQSVSCKLKEDRYGNDSWNMTSSHPILISSSFNLESTADIKTAYKKWQDLIADKKKFESDVKRIIHSLGTPKNILEQVPELANYFAAKSNALIPVDQIKSIRSQLVK